MKKPFYQQKKFIIAVATCIGVIADQYLGLQVTETLLEMCKQFSESCTEALK